MTKIVGCTALYTGDFLNADLLNADFLNAVKKSSFHLTRSVYFVNVRQDQEKQTKEEMVEEADEDEEQAEQLLTREEEVEEREGQLSSANVRELLSILETLKNKVVEVDNQPARAATAVASLNTAMQSYTDLFRHYMSNRQQALITRYFTSLQPPPPSAHSLWKRRRLMTSSLMMMSRTLKVFRVRMSRLLTQTLTEGCLLNFEFLSVSFFE